MNGYTPVVVVVVVATHTYTRRDAKLKCGIHMLQHTVHTWDLLPGRSFSDGGFLSHFILYTLSFFVGWLICSYRSFNLLGGGTTFHFCIHALSISNYLSVRRMEVRMSDE